MPRLPPPSTSFPSDSRIYFGVYWVIVVIFLPFLAGLLPLGFDVQGGLDLGGTFEELDGEAFANVPGLQSI